MVDQGWKDLLSFLIQPPVWLLARWYRLNWTWRRPSGCVRLHLGCGRKYLPGFINADFNPLRKVDLWVDLRRRLPFPDRAVDGIYSAEFMEHLYPADLQHLLRECSRILKPGGRLRLEVPHLGRAAAAYVRADAAWFPDWPRSYRSLGGRFSNFLLCDGQHRSAFDFSMLQELLEDAGFHQIEECAARQSRWIEPGPLSSLEPAAETAEAGLLLYVEAARRAP